MTTKSVDSRGRLNLGRAFANRLVIVKQIPGGALQIIPAEAVPAREAWLHNNPDTIRSVVQGLEEAENRRFAEPPDMDADSDWADFKDEAS